MNENLRDQYVAFLQRFGLKPRAVPANAPEVRKAVLAYLTELNAQDAMTRSAFEALQDDPGRYDREARHPATILLERRAEHVEKMIASLPFLAGAFQQNVFVGEFPTGRINAQAVNVEGGYLVLVDSGTLTVVKQVTEYLVIYGDPDHPADSQKNGTAIEGVCQVLDAYLEFGDPFFGPKPLSGGLQAYLRHFVADTMMEFVLAHEYSHVLAGHFGENHRETTTVDTRVGQVSMLRKEWRQELEADALAYKIVLGVEGLSDIDRTVMDKPYDDPEHCTGREWAAALRLKSAIAAPFLFLTLDSLLQTVASALRAAKGEAQPESSHPSARERMDQLSPVMSDLPPKYSGFINYASILWANEIAICQYLFDKALQRAES